MSRDIDYDEAREQAEEDVDEYEFDGYKCPVCDEIFDYDSDLREHWMDDHSGFDADDHATHYWEHPDNSERYEDREEAIRATLVSRGYELPKDRQYVLPRSEQCRETKGSERGFFCSLKKGHSGKHQAWGAHIVNGNTLLEEWGEDDRVDDTKYPAPFAEWCRDNGRTYVCTRYPGHEGDHMARTTGGALLDRWPNESAKPDAFPANHSGQSCKDQGSTKGYVCSREPGHTDDHVATMGFYKPSSAELERWPNKEESATHPIPRYAHNISKEPCSAESPGGWYCTREKGHDGDHMALTPHDELYDSEPGRRGRGEPVWDDLDTLKPEDDDDDNYGSCDVRERDRGDRFGYYCTRTAGHEGDHIATEGHATEADRDDALAVWRNDAPGAYPGEKDERTSSARQESKSVFEAMMEGDEATG